MSGLVQNQAAMERVIARTGLPDWPAQALARKGFGEIPAERVNFRLAYAYHDLQSRARWRSGRSLGLERSP